MWPCISVHLKRRVGDDGQRCLYHCGDCEFYRELMPTRVLRSPGTHLKTTLTNAGYALASMIMAACWPIPVLVRSPGYWTVLYHRDRPHRCERSVDPWPPVWDTSSGKLQTVVIATRRIGLNGSGRRVYGQSQRGILLMSKFLYQQTRIALVLRNLLNPRGCLLCDTTSNAYRQSARATT